MRIPVVSILSLPLLFMAFGLGAVEIKPGNGSFTHQDESAKPPKPVTVYYHRPDAIDETTPVLFVMHGMTRDAKAVRNIWEPLARRHRILLLAPEFSTNHYSSAAYNRGGMEKQPDESKWTFAVIERLFDLARRETGIVRTNYLLFGHSAGGQFVHRFIEYRPHARVERAVAANAGYYTMPAFDREYPYGFKGSAMTDHRLRTAFSRKLLVLLGENDTDPEHHQLTRTPQAMEQGRHRFERGQNFFSMAREKAQSMDAAFNWSLQTVPGVGHSTSGVAPVAAKWLFGTGL